MKKKQKLPDGLTEKDVLSIIDHYDNQTDDEAVAEDEAAFRADDSTMMQVPRELVGKVRALIVQAAKAKRPKAA